jgi:hypothetical protein
MRKFLQIKKGVLTFRKYFLIDSRSFLVQVTKLKQNKTIFIGILMRKFFTNQEGCFNFWKIFFDRFKKFFGSSLQKYLNRL